MAMVAVGGSIGTGLLLGSGAAVSVAGPAIIFTYLIGAVIAFIVTMALGEVAARHPEAGSFGVAAELYLGPWAGFVTRYGYWISIVLSVGAEQVAAAAERAITRGASLHGSPRGPQGSAPQEQMQETR